MHDGKDQEQYMKQLLTGLKERRREEEEKRYQRYWAEIKVPFTLDEGLSKYTKHELDTIRKTLNIKDASSLKKAELIILLQEKIPEYLEQIVFQLDVERFELLTNIAKNNGQIIAPNVTNDQIEYFRANGLIYTGTFEKKKILAAPKELIGQITAWKDNVNIRATVKRNTEWIKLTHGLLYYYGTLTRAQLVQMLEETTKESINIEEFLAVILNANSYFDEIHIDNELYSNFRVFDPERVLQEHQSRSSVPFYPFTKQQLLTAGEPGFVEKNQSYVQLVKFLTKNFEIDWEEADKIAEECVYATRIGDGPNDILEYLSHIFDFDDMEIVQEFMDEVVHLMNNTREWFLKGYTSTELLAQEQNHLRPLPVTKQNRDKGKKVVKIGRNAPCPCGSGKKYKKCCGR
ncbi:YecA family protein [Pseudogracilibacillus sp. SO30301A]|uniref:YecA family protein n=1 Tax=Pseudogracilibacillus sp. SO30301A TaxID=3098291 RepID=UPI00300DC62C